MDHRGRGRGPRRLKDRAPEWRVELHDGITDAEYATTLRVLMRMMGNAGATVPAI
ncbi:hypothetical protein ACFQVA_18285 [Actinomadura keratinilytica]